MEARAVNELESTARNQKQISDSKELVKGQVIKGWDQGIKIMEQKMLFLPFLRHMEDVVHLQLFH